MGRHKEIESGDYEKSTDLKSPTEEYWPSHVCQLCMLY